MTAVRFVRGWTAAELRALRLLPADQAKLLLQPSSFTLPDRYPGIFGFVRDRLSDVAAPWLLSFGCSTGEEAFSLRDYFPDAAIEAIDINAHSIRRAEAKRASRRDEGIRFQTAPSPAIFPDENFDAIFAMAVFRHGRLQAERPDRCDPILDFATVDALTAALAKCLKPGGYLAIWHAQFRFADMAASAGFETVLQRASGVADNQPLYGPDNRRIANAIYCDAVFRKADR